MRIIIIFVCSFQIIFSSCTCNSLSYDNKIWETNDMHNSGLTGKWLHPFGDRILEITDEQIIEYLFNGRQRTIRYKIVNEKIIFYGSTFSFEHLTNNILLLTAKDDFEIQIFNVLEDDILKLPPTRFYTGLYHRINNIGITVLRKGKYDFAYCFGKWSYRGFDGMQAPSYWLRARFDHNSLDSLEFLENGNVLIRRICFIEENKDKNPWGGFVSSRAEEEYEYEIIGSDLFIKANKNLLKLKIVNKNTVFYEPEKSVFIFDDSGICNFY